MLKILTICLAVTPALAFAQTLEAQGPAGGWGVPPSLPDRIEAEREGGQAEAMVEAQDKAAALQQQLNDERSRRAFGN